MRKISYILALCAGGFLSVPAHAVNLGPEVATNGRFDTATGWYLGNGWQIAPGSPPQGMAWHEEGYHSAIFQPPGIPMNGYSVYQVTYKISGSAGSSNPSHYVRFRGDTNVMTPVQSGDGVFTSYIVAPANVNMYGVIGGDGLGAVLDDVSIREVLP